MYFYYYIYIYEEDDEINVLFHSHHAMYFHFHKCVPSLSFHKLYIFFLSIRITQTVTTFGSEFCCVRKVESGTIKVLSVFGMHHIWSM